MRSPLVWYAIALLTVVIAVAGESATGFAVEAGQPAPPLTVRQFDGGPFDLAAERGKVVIVHFWATWCPSYRTEMPVLEAVYDRYHRQGLEWMCCNFSRGGW